MSLLSAVLQEAERVNTQELKKTRDQVLPFVKDLTERIQLLSWALQQNIIDTYVNFTITKSLEQLNYNNRKAKIIFDHSKCIEDIKLLQDRFEENDEDFASHCAKLSKSFEILEDLSIIVEGKRILEKANHEFGRYNYSEAMLAVKKLKMELNNLKFEGNMAKALTNITAQAENQLALYTAQLSLEWEDLFKWSETKGLKFLSYSFIVQQSDPILFQKILKTLYVTDRMHAELGLFSHFFINNLLHNVIRHNCDMCTEDPSGSLVFNIKITLNDPNKPNYQTIFNNLMIIFEFLQSTLGSQFEGDKTFIEIFAETIRQKFFNKIIEDCIRMNLPSCDSSYRNYKNIVIELEAFNKFLIDLKFVKADESPLNKYIDDTECVLYNKKCDKLLSDVRILLKESLSYGTIVVGSVPNNENDSTLDVTDNNAVWDITKPLFLPKCVISQNIKAIMTLITEHLEESAKLPEKYSRQLVSYIKDIAVMYQSLVPKKFKINLECCPAEIALFFNNCFYLAHGLLGPPWCNSLPKTLADQLNLVLLESIQDLRVLGLEKMSLYLQSQRSSIMQSIEAKGTAWSLESYEQFDCAINKALSLMKDLKSCWYNVLPTRMYEMSICTLVQALCQSVLERVMSDCKPVSEELVYMLAMRAESTVAGVYTLFEEPIEFETKINIWLKFTKLPLLLKAQLLEISDLWNNDRDQFKSYTCEEVRQIVKMRFPDDKYRLKILKEIQ
nr:centromere/kinetochore protein zw10 homolog [Helicoverpa armigera]